MQGPAPHHHKQKWIKQAGETAQQLRTFAEGPCLVPTTHTGELTMACNVTLASKPDALF